MSLHHLRAVAAKPELDHLASLRAVGAYEALPLLAGHHQGLRGAAPFRVAVLCTQVPHVFPLPDSVVDLLDGLFAAIERLFSVSARADDDVRVAVFAAFGVTAIHPFDNGNGRTAFDFAQLLLMQRWGLATPPFVLPPDAHQRLGPILMEMDEPSTSWEPMALQTLSDTLRHRFASMRLEDLGHTPLERIVEVLRALLDEGQSA